MQSVTPADYEAGILAARGKERKLILLKSMDFVMNKGTYETHFGGALDAFVLACASLSQRQDVNPRWKSLIRSLFQDAGQESRLSPIVRAHVVDEVAAARAKVAAAKQVSAGEGSKN